MTSEVILNLLKNWRHHIFDQNQFKKFFQKKRFETLQKNHELIVLENNEIFPSTPRKSRRFLVVCTYSLTYLLLTAKIIARRSDVTHIQVRNRIHFNMHTICIEYVLERRTL